MKATVLVDNTPFNGLEGEWGLSIFIEYKGKNILLDTGASGLFLENAKKLGIDIEKVDYGVLSHAHFDHGNGIQDFFENNSKAKFYFQEKVGANCYDLGGEEGRYIGIPKNLLTDYKERIELVHGKYELCEGVCLLSHTTPNLIEIGKRENMYQKTKAGYVTDDFSHEQSLVFETEKGMVVFNSCSHGGAANIIREVQNAFPGKNVAAMIGGFHLYNKTDDEVRSLARKIKETGISYICTGHCTEARGLEILQEELGDIVHKFHVNLVMEF